MSRYTAWIGTNSTGGSRGIYTLSVDTEQKEARIIAAHKAYNTGALALSPDGAYLYAASEGMSFQGYASGGAMAYAIKADSSLTVINAIPTMGQRPCCLALLDGKQLYAANFFGGSISVMALRPDGGIGELRVKITEPAPTDGWLHAMHAVAVMDEKHIAAANISQSEIVVYNGNSGKRLASYAFVPHSFPRSLAVSDACIYCMMQNPAEIYVFEKKIPEDGKLHLLQKCETLPGYAGDADTSVIRLTPDGKMLLAADRKTNALSAFRIGADGILAYLTRTRIPGDTPRDFAITPDSRAVFAAMQSSGEVQVLELNRQTGALKPLCSAEIPSPAAVVIRKEEDA